MAVSEVFRNTHRLFVDRGLPGYDVEIPQILILPNGENCVSAGSSAKLTNSLGETNFSPAMLSALPILRRYAPLISQYQGDSSFQRLVVT